MNKTRGVEAYSNVFDIRHRRIITQNIYQSVDFD